MDDGIIFSDGVTLRDRFAIAWMTGINNKWEDKGEEFTCAEKFRRRIAREAYAFADAMMVERGMKQSSGDNGCAVIDPEKDFAMNGIDYETMMQRKYGQRVSMRKAKL